MSNDLLIVLEKPFRCKECKIVIISIKSSKIQILGKFQDKINAYGTFCPQCSDPMIYIDYNKNYLDSKVNKFIELGEMG